jgi:hypothetical protein
MADRSALGLVGVIFSGIAATVMLVAYLVVRDHVEGQLVLEGRAMAAGGKAVAATGKAVAATNAAAATEVR